MARLSKIAHCRIAHNLTTQKGRMSFSIGERFSLLKSFGRPSRRLAHRICVSSFFSPKEIGQLALAQLGRGQSVDSGCGGFKAPPPIIKCHSLESLTVCANSFQS